jgi:hypothetical protein
VFPKKNTHTHTHAHTHPKQRKIYILFVPEINCWVSLYSVTFFHAMPAPFVIG